MPSKKRTPAEIAAEDARIEAEARALFEGGDAPAALGLLGKRAVFLARHATTTLPCLCKRCLQPELATAESSGVAYVRDFVVQRHRVLFYWTPEELRPHSAQVRASMRSELRFHLERRARGLDSARQRPNPFARKLLP